jgi:hypothetical protein
MRRDTKKIKKVYTAKSESRFTVYESKSMVKQEWYTDLLEKSSLKGIARGTQLRRYPEAQKKSSKDYLQQGLVKIIKLTVDINKKMGIIISVDSLKGIII